MPTVRRHMPEWHPPESRDHSIGGQIITFDDDNEAEVDDPEVLAVMQAFPETFAVVEPVETAEAPAEPPTEDAPPEEPTEEAAPSGYGEHELEMKTVADLQEIAELLNILGVRSMRKADLIEAILTQQRITGGR